MHPRHTALSSRERALLCAYAPACPASRLSDPAAWFALSLALRHITAYRASDTLQPAPTPSGQTLCLVTWRPASKPSSASAPDIETRLFALFAE